MQPRCRRPSPAAGEPDPDAGFPALSGHNQRVQNDPGQVESAAVDPPLAQTWRSAFANRLLATAFAGQAGLYARLRPGYPAVAIDLAIPAGASRILDLGAGTGKLTGPVLARGPQVIAVEPLEAMLAELRRAFPAAIAVAGTAEFIPLADASVDAIMVGQAFHWFDAARALPEMARVLRPGGTLTLLWNHDDAADPLVSAVQSALDRAGRPAGGSTGRAAGTDRIGEQANSTDTTNSAAKTGAGPAESVGTISSRWLETRAVPFAGDPMFADPELTEITWTREQSVEEYLGLQRTYSYVIRASNEVRATLDAEVRAILQGHQPDNQLVRIPVICQVWRSTCL